ncbi:DUF3237 domain-containing protein [Jiulongibacter sp. NS-SX5]|uniref:DUF3237 domain-containing protein n=1 Tax=Jiulongibacter sp. NS-SX5 TaxID=3463854 RepID=UPI004057D24C
MKYLTLFIFMTALAGNAFSQGVPPAPELEYICELRVKLDPPLTVGQTPRGLRRIIPIIGGTVEGPEIKGEIIGGGADWQFIREDGVAELEAHYQFKTDDGVIIYVKNDAMRVASPEVAAKIAKGIPVEASEYYFKGRPKLEAPEGKYHWMNNTMFICQGVKNPLDVSIFIWRVK